MAGIAVAEETPWVSYTASGGQTSFAYTWPIYEESHLAVYKNGTLLTLTTHYTVTGEATESGGNVVLNTGATANDVIVIAGVIPLARTSQYDVDRPFAEGQLDEDLDRLALMANRLELMTMRCPQRTLDDWHGSQMSLPDPDEDKVLGWDAATGQLKNVDPGTVGEAGDAFNAAVPEGGRTVTTLEQYLANNAVYNVLDFGASALGVIEAVPFFQAAINAAEAAGGGVVFVPKGTYKISSGLTIENENVSLEGEGRASILKCGASGITMITVGVVGGTTANAGNILQRFHIDFNECNSTGIHWESWGQIGVARDIHVTNPGLTAVGIYVERNTKVNEVCVEKYNWWNQGVGDGGTDQGTAIVFNGNNCRVIDSTIIGAKIGIDWANTNATGQGEIQLNRISRNETGIRIGNAGQKGNLGPQIIANRFENNVLRDIHANGLDQNSPVVGMCIAFNHFNKSAGIYLKWTKGTTMIGNMLHNASTEHTSGRTMFVEDGNAGASNGNLLITSIGWLDFLDTVFVETPLTNVLDPTLAPTGYTGRFMEKLCIGPTPNPDAPTQANSMVYVSNNGEVCITARDSTNNAELFVAANTLGASIGSKTAHDLRCFANNTARLALKSAGDFHVYLPGAAPADGQFALASMAEVSFYVDEAGNALKVKVKYADGTTFKTGTIALT